MRGLLGMCGILATAVLAGCSSPSADPITELVAQLRGDDLELRRAAAAHAAGMESLPAELEAPLLQAVADADLQVRLDAAEALGRADNLALVPEIARLAESHPCPRTRERLVAASESLVARGRERGLVAP